MKTIRSLGIIFLFISINTAAQQLTTEGKEFWVSFLKNYSPVHDRLRLKIYISAKQNCTGTIQNANGSFIQHFSATAGTVTEIEVSKDLFYTYNNQVIASKGLYVRASVPISLFAWNYRPSTSDATAILPSESLGTEYVIMDYFADLLFLSESQFLILATEDGTEVEIDPTQISVAGTPAQPFLISLNKGETYQYTAWGDLSGSAIRVVNSCKKIAVFSGNSCTNVPAGCYACDHLFEQSFPVNTFGTQYLITPTLNRPNDIIKIMAVRDNTSISINGTALPLLNKGIPYEISINHPVHIASDKPIQAALFGIGNWCKPESTGDPMMINISPVEQAIESIYFISPASSIVTSHYVNIHVKTVDVNKTFLDGINIGNQFIPFTNPEYSYARIPVTAGQHAIKNEGGFSAYAYGYGTAESYGFSAGSKLAKLNQYFLADNRPSNLQDTIYCAPSFVVLEALTKTPSYTSLKWLFSDNTTSNQPKIIKDFPGSGIYKVQLVVEYPASACSQTDTSIVFISVNKKVSLGADTILCSGSTLVLQPDLIPAGSTFSWSDGSASPSLTVNKGGIYWVKLKNGPCESSDTITVNEKPLPTASIVLNPGNDLCAGAPVTLTAGGGSSFNWSNGSRDASITTRVAGDFSVMVKNDDGCSNSAAVTIRYKPELAFTVSEDRVICPGDTIILSASGGTNYIWRPRDLILKDQNTQIQVAPLADTKYICKIIKDNNGCIVDKEQEVKVTVKENIRVFAGNDSTVHPNIPLSIRATAAGPGLHYLWRPSAGLNNPTVLQPAAVIADDMTYILTASSSEGCSRNDTVNLKVFKSEDVFIPSAFTPNGDQLNDLMRPILRGGITLESFSIYNREGQILFTTKQSGIGWNGKFKGIDQPSGNYVFVVYMKKSNGTLISKTGSFILVR